MEDRSTATRIGRAWLGDRLFGPVSIAPLVWLRIAFGLMMLVEVYRYFAKDWIAAYYLRPRFFFPFFGFEWVKPWPGQWMYVHFAALGVLAACVTIGFCYRAAALLFWLGFTYVFLLDQSNYLNHFYLISLFAFLLALAPAHRAISVDAWLRPGLRASRIPAWSFRLLQFQLAAVYVFGGIAKLNGDWIRGKPLDHWLAARSDMPVLGPLFEYPATWLFFSWSGLLIDLFIVPALLWRRTRVAGIVVIASFHLLNAQIFSIGIFPWLGLATTALLFLPGWRLPSVWLSLPGASRDAPPPSPHARSAFAAVVTTWVVIQVGLPLRHFAYPGNVSWTEEGHLFSWHMKLRDKSARLRYVVTAPEEGRTWTVNPARYLTSRQTRKMRNRPEMIRHFARELAEEYRRQGHDRVEVRADSWVSLNGRPFRRMIDPTVDLAAEPARWGPAPWIIPLDRAPSEAESPALVRRTKHKRKRPQAVVQEASSTELASEIESESESEGAEPVNATAPGSARTPKRKR